MLPISTHGLEHQTILIVDDNRDLCTALAHQLRQRLATVVVAHNLSDALGEARAWRPTRTLLDLRLSDGNGLAVVPQLLEICPTMRIVVLTGFGSIATAVEAMKLGATHYLTKPVDIDDIVIAFDRVHPCLSAPPPPLHSLPIEVVEWEHLQRILTDCNGNISEAARRLGMHRRSLQRKLARGRPQQAS